MSDANEISDSKKELDDFMNISKSLLSNNPLSILKLKRMLSDIYGEVFILSYRQ
jgi:hypothetical protein